MVANTRVGTGLDTKNRLGEKLCKNGIIAINQKGQSRITREKCVCEKSSFLMEQVSSYDTVYGSRNVVIIGADGKFHIA